MASANPKVGRRREDGIAAENEERLHAPRQHVGRKRGERCGLVHRAGFHGVGVLHRLADIVQRVDSGRGPERGRPGIARSPATTRLVPRCPWRSLATAAIHLAWHRTWVPRDRWASTPVAFARAQAKPSISVCRSGSRWSAAAPVREGVLSTTYSRFIWLPPGSPADEPRIRRAYRTLPGPGGEEISAQGDRSRRLCPRGKPCSPPRRTPARSRRGPCRGWRVHTDATWPAGILPVPALSCWARVGEVTVSVRILRPPPWGSLDDSSCVASAVTKAFQVLMVPAVRDRLGPVGIVEREQRRLGEDVRGTQAPWMLGVALDLGGSTDVAFHQQARGDTPSDIAVAKKRGLPGITSSGARV